jgi:NAD(P)-dependent dehydrogenase (short-subunit alcohol dehydrogenase family)
MRVFALGRDAAALDETCSLVRTAGGEAEGISGDVCDLDAMASSIDRAAGEQGIDVFVHNAGIGGSTPVADPDFERWDRILDVDLRAPMKLTALSLPHVVKRQGIFVFIGSISAKMGMAGSGAYCAAKHGLNGFAEALFEEVREQGVRVARIHPGYVNTEMVGGRGLDESKMIQPADIAELVHTAVELPPTTCVVEMIVRPQRSPYRA